MDSSEEIMAINHNGKFYLSDGHHRIANDILNGEDTVSVRVYDDSVEYQTGVTKSKDYKDESVQYDTQQSEPLPVSKVGNQSPQESIANFEKFFNGSKVTDNKGKPKTVYHGTTSDFDTFDINHATNGNFGKGFYFGEDIKKVNEHWAKGEKANIIPVNLNIKKPFNMDAIDKEFATEYIKSIGKTTDDLPNSKNPSVFYKLLGSLKGKNNLNDFIKSSGYDGIVGTTSGAKKQWVAFKPEQIKSINNKGTFDGNNPSIIHSSSTAGSALLGGAIGGIEEDENGNYTLNPEGMIIGALAGSALGYSSKKALEFFRRNADETAEGLKEETRLEWIQRKLQDKFNRVKQLQKTTGEELADDMDMYQMEANMHGRIADQMDRVSEKIIQPLIKKIAKSDYSVDDLDQYLWARHAKERNAKMWEDGSELDAPSGMTDAEADRILAELDTPQMREFARYVDNINEATLRKIEQEGLESPEYMEMLRNGYQHYVPLHREVDKGLFGMGTGRGFDIKGKEFKRAKGSELPVESPLVHSIVQFQKALARSEKNRVGKTLLKFIEANPNTSIYTVKGVNYTPQYDDMGNIVRMNPSYKLEDNVMHVKVDGKIKEVTFHDDALASAFKNLGASEMKDWVKPVHKMVRFLASVSTQYNPEFVLSNFTRDIQTAMMNVPKEVRPSRLKMGRDVLPAIAGIKKSINGDMDGEWGKWFREMKAEGGTTGWMEQYNFEDLKKQINRDIDLQTTKNVAKKGYKKWLDFLDEIDNVNTAVENGIRLVVYRQAREAGISEAKSANIAKELTVNFNKKGEAGTALNTAYMFYNASIQGSVRMVKALAKNKYAQSGAVGLAGIGAYLEMHNNAVAPDEWRRIPDYKKDMNIIIMKENGEHVSIPLPYGYNVFKVFGEISAEIYNGEKRDVGGRALGALVSAFSPIGANSEDPIHTATPTIAKLPYELSKNQNFFGGNIRPETKYKGTDKADAQKYFKSVHPLARNTAVWMNEVTGGNYYESGLIDTSPENLEHAMEFVSGGLGKFIMNSSRWIPTKGSEAVDGNIVDGETSWSKVPFARRFYGEPHDQAPKMMAYDKAKKAEKTLFNKKEVDEFERDLLDAVKSNDLDKKRARDLRRDFQKGQIKVKWAKKYNIQDKPTKRQKYELDKMIFTQLYRNKKYEYGSSTIKSQARKLLKQKKEL